MKKNSGFTLLELVITIAVVAILTAIAVPNAIAWRQDATFRGAVNTLSSDLAAAKQSAIKNNSHVVVEFAPNGLNENGKYTYTIFIDNGEGSGTARNGTRDGDERIIVQRAATPAVSIDFANPPNSKVTFNAKGLSTATDTVSVALKTGSGSKNNSTVFVNRVGKIGVTW